MVNIRLDGIESMLLSRLRAAAAWFGCNGFQSQRERQDQSDFCNFNPFPGHTI